MREHLKIFLVLVLMLVGTQICFAQKIDAFARVSVSPREGVVRQPYKVTISVYSGTWFAKPLQFANLRIDNAFIIPFTRTVSSISYINNKKYATLSFYYLVFPYNTGNLKIPELDINTSIPPEGDYKGMPYTIRSKAQNIKVNPIPSAKDEDVWMVAQNISFNEEWNKSLEDLKVGDVLERKITIRASGTLPTLIQPLKIEKPEWVSTYPQEPVLQDKRDNKGVNGVRIESYSYLFEEEGEITLPAQELLWWNPDTKRVYKRTIPEQKLKIKANPDLAMMESLKDSLLAISAPLDIGLEEEKPFPWLRLGFVVILAFLTLYFAWKTVRIIVLHSKEKRAVYLQSEAYYFKQVLYAIKSSDTKEFIRALYVWFDKARKPDHLAAISSYLEDQEREVLENVIACDSSELSSVQCLQLKKLLASVRRKLISSSIPKNFNTKLNPTSF